MANLSLGPTTNLHDDIVVESYVGLRVSLKQSLSRFWNSKQVGE